MLFAFSSKAQKTVEYGIKAGYTISTLTTEIHFIDATPNSGFIVGGYTKIPLGGRMSFQPELLIAQKGYHFFHEKLTLPIHYFEKLDSPFLYIVDRERSHRLTYLSLPLNLMYSTSKGMGFLVGVEPSFLIHELRSDKYTGMKNVTITNTEKEHEPFDFGLVLGVNIQRDKFNFDIRYVQGLMQAREFWDYSSINSTVQMTLGYRLYKKLSYY